MRILVLHHYLPHPPDEGGRLRSHDVLTALVAEHEVTFVSLDDPAGVSLDGWELARSFTTPPTLVDRTSRETLTPGGEALRKLRPRPAPGCPSSVRATDVPALWNLLAKLPLDRFDAVQGRDLHLLQFIVALGRRHPHLKLVLDLDDVQSEARRIRLQTWPRLRPSRARVWLDYRRLDFYERRYLTAVDSVWVCKDEDVELLGKRLGHAGLETVPNVIDVDRLSGLARPDAPPRLVFVGKFRISHNEHGASWFVEQVWPGVRSRVADAELWLVGKEPTAPILQAHDPSGGVNVAADVPDVSPYLANARVSIVPLRFGSGTRLKMLEAMAAGLPVVSTTLGASGLGVRNGEHCLIADDADAFARACVSLLEDDGLRRRLLQAAEELVRERFDRPVMRSRVSEIYRRLAADHS